MLPLSGVRGLRNLARLPSNETRTRGNPSSLVPRSFRRRGTRNRTQRPGLPLGQREIRTILDRVDRSKSLISNRSHSRSIRRTLELFTPAILVSLGSLSVGSISGHSRLHISNQSRVPIFGISRNSDDSPF